MLKNLAKNFLSRLLCATAMALLTGCSLGHSDVDGDFQSGLGGPVQTLYNLVLGQVDSSTVAQNQLGSANPSAIVYFGGKTILADSSNHRVLIWNNFPSSRLTPPDVALGQPSINSLLGSNHNGCTGSSLKYPAGVSYDGTRLFVADLQNHRVLVWNSLPTQSGQSADYVLGQSSLTSCVQYGGGGTVSASGFSSPNSVFSNGTKLVITDSASRVLIYSSLPTANGASADVVVGQTTFTGSTLNSGGLSAASLYAAQQALISGGKLVIADYRNCRVLLFNTVPTTNGASADNVIGQTDFVTGCSGSTSATLLRGPSYLAFDGTRLLVTDSDANRLLLYNSLPTTDGVAPDVVLGQSSTTASSMNAGNGSTPSALGLRNPTGAAFAEGGIVVCDADNHRVVRWNSLPAAAGTAADRIFFGQPNFIDRMTKNAGASGVLFKKPVHLSIAETAGMAVTDEMGNRVLLWSSVPNSSNVTATIALGQENLVDNDDNRGGSATASTLNRPLCAGWVENKFLVCDSRNNRLLVWGSTPSAHGEAASYALGQPDLVSETANNGGISAATLSAPAAFAFGSGVFAVADKNNHRVLLWNGFPETQAEPADVVLGQPDMASNSSNNGGASSRSLNKPIRVVIHAGKLFVLDQENHRVLIWNTLPNSNHAPADIVLGQNGFTGIAANGGGTTSAASLYYPAGMHVDENGLWIADTENHRVLGWSEIPESSGTSSDRVFGQADAVSSTILAGAGSPSSNNLNLPYGVFLYGGSLWTVDSGNSRILASVLD